MLRFSEKYVFQRAIMNYLLRIYHIHLKSHSPWNWKSICHCSQSQILIEVNFLFHAIYMLKMCNENNTLQMQ